MTTDEARKNRIREDAVRRLIATYPGDYAALMAATLGNGDRWDTRRRDALATMRAENPLDWKRCLREAREADSATAADNREDHDA